MLLLTSAILWTKENWRWLVLGLCVLFALTTWRGCIANIELNAKLLACETNPPQRTTVTAKANQSVQIVYRDGSPCPDVTATNGSEAVSTIAEAKPVACPAIKNLGLWVGGGYLAAPYLSVGASYGDWAANAKRSMDAWGGEVSYRLLAF